MRNTPTFAGHPGFVLLKYFMWPLNCSIEKAARLLGISSLHMQGLVEGIIDVDNDLAKKLTIVFGRTPAFWTGLQTKYEAWVSYTEAKSPSVVAEAAEEVAKQAVAAKTLKDKFLTPRGITVEELAKRLRLPVRYVRKLVSGSGKLYAALADRLAETFGTTREYWLNFVPRKQLAMPT